LMRCKEVVTHRKSGGVDFGYKENLDKCIKLL
jgi:hypothetical protein